MEAGWLERGSTVLIFIKYSNHEVPFSLDLDDSICQQILSLKTQLYYFSGNKIGFDGDKCNSLFLNMNKPFFENRNWF